MPANGAAKPGLERVEHRAGIARSGVERLDRVADRADGAQQAPEGSKQTEKDQQSGKVARDIAAFVEPRGDRIEHRAHRTGRERHARGARQQRLHRRQQNRFVDLGAGPEGVDPAHLAKQPQGLQEGQDDADDENADDQSIETRVACEGCRYLACEDGGDEGHDGQEDHHRKKKHLRARKPVRIVFDHVGRTDQSDRSQNAHSRPDSVPAINLIATLSGNMTKLEDAWQMQRDHMAGGQIRATTRQSITAAKCRPAPVTTKPCQIAF